MLSGQKRVNSNDSNFINRREAREMESSIDKVKQNLKNQESEDFWSMVEKVPQRA